MTKEGQLKTSKILWATKHKQTSITVSQFQREIQCLNKQVSKP